MASELKKDDRIIYGLGQAQRILMTYLKGRLFDAGLPITVVQAGILFLLMEKDGRSMTELSRLLFTDNSSLTRLVDRLERDGLVQRLAVPRDRRTLLIAITEEGRKQAAAAERVVRSVNEEIRTRISPEELEVLSRVLGRIKRDFSRKKS